MCATPRCACRRGTTALSSRCACSTGTASRRTSAPCRSSATRSSASSQLAQETRRGGRLSELEGTLSYMSPEQARGFPVDRRCDVYALGLLLTVGALGVAAFHPASAALATVGASDQRPVCGCDDEPGAPIRLESDGYQVEIQRDPLRVRPPPVRLLALEMDASARVARPCGPEFPPLRR